MQVNMLQRKNDTLQKEVDNHDQRIQQVCQDGEHMIEENNPRSEEFQHLIANLLSQWQNLKQAIEQRRQRLEDSQRVQQYLFDCGEAEAWMGEQELYMMSDAGTTVAPVPVTPAQAQAQQTPTEKEGKQPTVASSGSTKWCKDEQNAQSQLKKHLQLESEVEDHATQIRDLGDRSRNLCANATTLVSEEGAEPQAWVSRMLILNLNLALKVRHVF